MNRDQAIARIKAVEPAVRAFGAASFYLFGSTARDEATASSDVDLFFDRDPSKPFGFDQLCGMEDVLEEALGTKVDLGTRTGLHPVLREEIEQSAIRVFWHVARIAHARLHDIDQTISKLLQTCRGRSQADLIADWSFAQVCNYSLQTIGEAVNHLPPEMLDAYPEVPWKKIIGLSHKVRHEYFRLDPDVI